MSTAAQVLRQAEALKATVSDNSKNVSEVCVSRQRMEDLYKKVLLMDLEYALDKKVEQELWNHAFKNQINTLQAQAKDKQNPKRSEIQASLNLFLEMASGVYLQLLQLVCSTFKLDLPFRRKSSTYGIMKERSLGKMKINPPKKSSCLYICQYCLVHLGDIARYRQQVDQAQSYYWHAAHLIPVNGQPYNQLAILEVARGNKLSTIFYYIRSLAVRHPFPATATNLEKFFSKISRERSEFRSKLSTTEFLTAFLQFHAFIHLCLELTRATDLSEKLLASMPAHVTSQSFSWHVLVQMLAINLFAMFHAARRSDASPDNSPHKEELSEDEERSYDIVFNFTVNTLEVLVTYTPKQEQKARGYFTMPAISVIMAWLRLDKDNFSKPVLRQSTLWPHLAKLFNAIQPLTTASMADSANRKGESDVALPEDFELRSFQPIEKAHSVLSFSQSVLEDRSPELMSTIRCQRLVNHGKWIAEQFPSLNLLNVKEEKPGRVIFSSATPMVKVLPAGTDTAPGEKKAVRQNVAIQAIIQKQKGTDNSPERSPANESSPQAKVSKDGRGDGKGDSHSPTKYLLGTPMKDPQFMKVSSGRSSGGNQTASSPSATTTRSPTVTFQLPPQQLSPKEKQHSEKPNLKMSTSGQSYQSRHNSANPPLGAQYRQMQHQQAMKQAKLQQQQQHLKQQQMQQQQQQKQQTWQGQRESQGQPSGNSAMNYSSELGPGQNQGQGNPNLQNVPQPSPNTLTMVQQQFLMQQQFEALQKMSAQAGNLQDGSPGSRPAPQQNLSPDGPASHAALIASQQQLLKAMATLHQQQQQQQQQGPQSAAQGPPMLGPQSSLSMRPQLPPHMSARPQHPSLGSMQSAPQASHPHQLQMQRPPLNIQQQQQPNSQPPFPGPMFMHQRFAAAGRPPNPGMPFNQQSQPGPQIPTNFNNSQEASRPIPGKFQNDPLSPGMFLNNYPGMPRHSFPFHFPTGQGAPSQHAGSPHPIGTPPGGSGFQGPTRDEREILAGMPQLTIQPPRSMSQGQTSARLNNMELPNESLMLGNPDSPHSGDGQHPLFKGSEVSADPPGRDSAQPGTYSLFSSTPWSVQISSAGDAKCQQQSLGSSPFSSQASSMRNSPDPGADFNTGDADLISGGAGLMQADGGLGTTFNLGLGFGTGDWGLQGGDNPGRPINSNLQGHSLWSSTGISPLQRLLEQQRQHRQNDPH